MAFRSILFLLLLVLVGSAFAISSGLTGTVNLRTTQVEVIWVDSASDMRGLLADNHITVNGDSEHGFSLRGHHAETGADVCVIYARRPTDVNDKETLVLGHELLHCLLGKYHP